MVILLFPYINQYINIISKRSSLKRLFLLMILLITLTTTQAISTSNTLHYNNHNNLSYLKTKTEKNKSLLNKSLFHSTESIYKNIRDLSNNQCKGMLFEEPFSTSQTKTDFITKNTKYDLSRFDNVLSLFKLSNYNSKNTNKLKVFIIAGEHARELISVELAYYFINILCTNSKLSEYFLNNFEYHIIPLANPLGRQLVENGHYCRRSNLNHVDPNRNWSDAWKKSENYNSDQYSGDFPFSEVESTFAKDSVTKFKPDIFLTLHSGVYGLFYPYASKKEEGAFNIFNIKTVLSELKSNFCPWCSLSTPSLFLNYISYGNCLDYVYDELKTKYSFAWEIYTNEINYKNHIKNNISERKDTTGNINYSASNKKDSNTQEFLKKESNYKEDVFGPSSKNNKEDNVMFNNGALSDDDYLNLTMGVSFLELNSQAEERMGIQNSESNHYSYDINDDLNAEYQINDKDIWCLKLFNPIEVEDYTFIIQNWFQMMLYSFKRIYELEKQAN